MKFSIRDLLWLTAVLALLLAAWREHTREPEVYYLHIYSTRVDRGFDPYNPDYDAANTTLGTPVRIASISITPGVPFSAEMPNDYNPTLHVKGRLFRRDTNLTGRVAIGLESPETAFDYEHVAPIKIEEPNPFWNYYHFVVSRSLNPYGLPASNPSKP